MQPSVGCLWSTVRSWQSVPTILISTLVRFYWPMQRETHPNDYINPMHMSSKNWFRVLWDKTNISVNLSGKSSPTFAINCTHHNHKYWLPRTVPFTNQTVKYVVDQCRAFLCLNNNELRLKGGYHTYVWRNWNDEGAVRQVSFCPKRRAVLAARTAFYTFHPSRPTRSSVVWF